ncbi:MAG: 4Fe-4S dicluster domain-containing protein [Planctomycetota bacterium]
MTRFTSDPNLYERGDLKVGESTASEAPVVRLAELDPAFKKQIMETPGGEHLLRCFACGTCTAGCPVREVDERYNPRRIVRMALLGMKDRVLKSDFIWMCSTCYSCEERCPQDVKLTDVMNAIKNLAVKEGHIHPAYTAQIDLIKASGRLYEIDEFDNKKREKAGLPALEPKVDEVASIIDLTGIGKA